MTTELCAYSVEACEAARRAGVTRVELCASPYEGGTTPSAAAIRMARRIGGLQLSVMVRPPGGGGTGRRDTALDTSSSTSLMHSFWDAA